MRREQRACVCKENVREREKEKEKELRMEDELAQA